MLKSVCVYKTVIMNHLKCFKEIVKSGEYGKVTGVKGLVAWFRPKAYYDVKPWRGKWSMLAAV